MRTEGEEVVEKPGQMDKNGPARGSEWRDAARTEGALFRLAEIRKPAGKRARVP